MRTILCILVALVGAGVGDAEDASATIRRQTQELLDAVTSGTPATWDRYLDPKVVYTAEDGSVFTKAQLVEQVKPLPPDISGKLEVIDFHATEVGETVITSYVSDENEVYFGHRIHCQYRTTDTWKKAPEGWRLLASQVLALRTTPPALKLSEKQMAEYTGRYTLSPKKIYEIRLNGGSLEGQEIGKATEVLQVEVPDLLFVQGKPRYRKVFQRGPDGRITGFVERREAWDLPWKRLAE